MTHHDKARDMVDELRGIRVSAIQDNYAVLWSPPLISANKAIQEAADLITALAEENQRLRDALKECEAEIDRYIWQEYPLDHPVHERYRQRDFIENPARVALSRTYTF